jgi:pyruvate, water dikinase
VSPAFAGGRGGDGGRGGGKDFRPLPAEHHAAQSGGEKVHAQVRAENEELAACTVRLTLLDPDDAGFTPEGCRSLHDLVRFCHEKSVAEMFSLVDRGGRGLGRSRRLETTLPLVMYVLDLGGGLLPEAGDKGPVGSDLLSCAATSLWAGLADERVDWDESQLHMDWETFDRISAGIFRKDSRILASYSIIASEYMHLNIRFGYHFSIVDALCGEPPVRTTSSSVSRAAGRPCRNAPTGLTFIRQVLERFGYET